MYFIGITGGAGSGKSLVLEYLEKNHGAYVIRADDVARDLVKKGNVCYEPYVELFGREALGDDGELDRAYIASKVFADVNLRLKMNALIHPAVKKFIIGDVEKIRLSGDYEFYFLEAALLIEENYDKICDELWYIYADEAVRRDRLQVARGYSGERTDNLLKSQKSENEFKQVCSRVIDNSGSADKTYKQLDRIITDLKN